MAESCGRNRPNLEDIRPNWVDSGPGLVDSVQMLVEFGRRCKSARTTAPKEGAGGPTPDADRLPDA